MLKKWSCAALSILLAAVMLSGCTDEKSELQIKEEKPEKTIITLFLPLDGNSYSVGIYKDVIADYNRMSDTIEIRVDGLSTGDGYNQALLQRLENGGEGADLFIVNADSVKQLNAKGYFYDLSGLSAYNLLNETAKEQARIDGTVYTIPLQMTAYGLYVNVGLLRQYGLEAPRNLNEFLHCCEVLKADGITPLSLNRWYALTCMAMSRGLSPLYQSEDKENLLAGLNDGSVNISSYMLDGFRFFKELTEKGYYGEGITAEEADAIKAGTSDMDNFVSGKTAFAVFTTSSVDQISRTAPDMEFIQQGFPVLPDGTVSMPTLAARLCVNAKGAHIEEALDAVEYLTATRAEEFIAEGSGFLPSIQYEKESSIDKRTVPIYQDAVSPGQVPIEDMSLRFTYWDTTRELCIKIIGGMSAEDAAKEYDRIQKEQINSYD